MRLEAFVDGGSRGNPGESGLGVYIPGTVRIAEYLGVATNNFAEYSALNCAVRFAVFTHCDELLVYADSELVVKQILGEYQVRNESIRPLYDSAVRWISLISRFSIRHIRREGNVQADILANLAMDQKRNLVEWIEAAPSQVSALES